MSNQDYPELLTEKLDELFLQNFTLKELKKLDSLYNFKVTNTFGEDYFDNRLEAFEQDYDVYSRDVSEWNLDTIEEATLHIRKILQNDDINATNITLIKHKTTDELQSINGQPAVSAECEDGFLYYYFIENSLICSANFPGIVIKTRHSEIKLFFDIRYELMYLFKTIFYYNDEVTTKYLDYDGNYVNYKDNPYYTTIRGNLITSVYARLGYIGYKSRYENKVTGNNLVVDDENKIIVFNGKSYTFKEWKTKFPAHPFYNLCKELVEQPTKYINPKNLL